MQVDYPYVRDRNCLPSRSLVKRLPRRSIFAASPVADISASRAAPSRKFSTSRMTGWFSYRSRRTFVDSTCIVPDVTIVKSAVRIQPQCQCHGRPGKIDSHNRGRLSLRWILTRHGETWLGYGPEDRDFGRHVLSGYHNAAASNSGFDYDRLNPPP